MESSEDKEETDDKAEEIVTAFHCLDTGEKKLEKKKNVIVYNS